MTTDIPTCREDLKALECIGHVSSRIKGADAWTELSVWYRQHESRCFVTVIEGRVEQGNPISCDGYSTREDRFRAVATGTLDRALAILEPSNLAMELASKIGSIGADRLERLYPDADTLRMRAAEKRREARGYMGRAFLCEILPWLYPDLADGSDNKIAAAFEADFQVNARTVRNIMTCERDGKDPPTWVNAFAGAMRHFDRKAWENRA